MTTAAPYDTYVYFGDSLSDNGNIFELSSTISTQPFPVPEAGYDERFSDGPVFVEYASDLLGAETVVNYAFGGAEALGVQTIGEAVAEAGGEEFLTVEPDDPILDTDLNLDAQVARFLEEFEGQDLSGVSTGILIGTNDYLAFVASEPENLIQEALALTLEITIATVLTARELAVAGVGEVVINSLPSSTFFPFLAQADPIFQSQADLVFQLHNTILERGAEALTNNGFNVVYVDLDAITSEIIEDATTFGLTAPTDEFLVLQDNPEVILNPALEEFDNDEIAFIDAVHPTTVTHEIIGTYQAAFLLGQVTNGTDENDEITTGEHDDVVFGSGGDDSLTLGGGNDTGFGGTGNDIVGGGAGADILSGGSGDDFIFGGDGRETDFIAGNDGNDIGVGGGGQDLFVEGLGADTILAGRGSDVVFIETDTIFADSQASLTNTIDLGPGNDLIIVSLNEDTAHDFLNLEAQIGTAGALADLGYVISGVDEIIVLTEDDAEDFFEDFAEGAGLDPDAWGLI